MGRSMIYAIMLAITIELALYLFQGTSYESTSLFWLIKNPSFLDGSAFYLIITAGLAVLVGSAVVPIIAGTSFNINQYAMYAGVAAALITFTATIVHLWSYTNGQLVDIGVSSAGIISSIIVLPLLLFFMIAVLDWVRGTD